MRLTLEVDGAEPVSDIPGEGAELVAIMSFAVVRGFGATHPLAVLADRLHALKVPLGPITTFYEREPEDAEDREKLERAWQDPAELALSLRAIARAMRDDEQAATLAHRGNVTAAAEEIDALLPHIDAAAAASHRVRLVYDL